MQMCVPPAIAPIGLSIAACLILPGRVTSTDYRRRRQLFRYE